MPKKESSDPPFPLQPSVDARFTFYVKRDFCLFRIMVYGSIYFYALGFQAGKLRKMLNEIGFETEEKWNEKEIGLDIFKGKSVS